MPQNNAETFKFSYFNKFVLEISKMFYPMTPFLKSYTQWPLFSKYYTQWAPFFILFIPNDSPFLNNVLYPIGPYFATPVGTYPSFLKLSAPHLEFWKISRASSSANVKCYNMALNQIDLNTRRFSFSLQYDSVLV